MLQQESENLLPSQLKFETQILRLYAKNEKRKASTLIEKHIEDGGTILSLDILKLVMEPSGMTVAHKLAHKGHQLTSPEILMLTGQDRSKENSLMGHNGCSVAFIMAKKGHVFSDIEILKLGSEDNRSTVAHAMAAHGFTFSDFNVLSLRDDKGTTVAHVMATKGHRFADPRILDLQNNFGFSVNDFQFFHADAASLSN